jgi:sugar lactone lactonase YvrE
VLQDSDLEGSRSRAEQRIKNLVLIAGSTLAMIVLLCTVLTGAAVDTTADRVLGQLDFTHGGLNMVTSKGLYAPSGVAIDRSVVPNRVYVADMNNNRVLGWHSAEALSNGAPADLVIGQPDFFSQFIGLGAMSLNGPQAVAVDAAGNLYVADTNNSRVLEYNSPFTTDTVPDLVFGQSGSLTSGTCNFGGSITDATLCVPSGVAVDAAGHVYIADTANSRVLEYNNPSASNTHADTVFGQAGQFNSGTCNKGGVSADSLCHPGMLTLDAVGNLYVVDGDNNRVLEYNTPLTTDTTADLVFGQSNSFTSDTNNCASPSATTLCGAAGVTVDSGANLYIADGSFSRILEFTDPVKTTDTTANLVFGQPNFSSSGCDNGGIGAATLCRPSGPAIDQAGNLYVADALNDRVLIFNSPLATKPPNTSADIVLGQLDFSHSQPNIAKPNSLYAAIAVGIDTSSTPNGLYVCDFLNNRVLGWHSVPDFINGAPADLVIGQPDFYSGNPNGATGYGLMTLPAQRPRPCFFLAGWLWIHKVTSMSPIPATTVCWNTINPSGEVRSLTSQQTWFSGSTGALSQVRQTMAGFPPRAYHFQVA